MMPDGWEVEWGTDPLVDDSGSNPDGDWWDANHNLVMDPDEAFTNLQEYTNGTDPQNDDTDGDTMGDGYEALYGLDPLDYTDSDDDPDGDGLTNRKEHLADTSPVDADTDGDGMDDKFEQEWGLNPVWNQDGVADMDGDAFTNIEEYMAGTNITNPDTDSDGVVDGHDVAPLTDIGIRISITHVSFDSMVEGTIDNPAVGKSYEIYIKVKVGDEVQVTKTTVTLETDLNVTYFIVFDVPDNVRNVTVTIGLWENDTMETSGLDPDDHLDVDGASDDVDCDLVYDVLLGTWKGDTTTGTTDGHADGLPPDADHPDGILTFAIEVVPI
jgi:hypothetical protein